MIYSVGLMLLGGQFMSIGFLAELIIAYHTPDVRGYSISETTFAEHARRAAGPPRPPIPPRERVGLRPPLPANRSLPR